MLEDIRQITGKSTVVDRRILLFADPRVFMADVVELIHAAPSLQLVPVSVKLMKTMGGLARDTRGLSERGLAQRRKGKLAANADPFARGVANTEASVFGDDVSRFIDQFIFGSDFLKESEFEDAATANPMTAVHFDPGASLDAADTVATIGAAAGQWPNARIVVLTSPIEGGAMPPDVISSLQDAYPNRIGFIEFWAASLDGAGFQDLIQPKSDGVGQ